MEALPAGSMTRAGVRGEELTYDCERVSREKCATMKGRKSEEIRQKMRILGGGGEENETGVPVTKTPVQKRARRNAGSYSRCFNP